MDALSQFVTLGSGMVLILGAIVAWFRWIRPFIRRANQDITSGRDALLGREEIRDSITGRVLAPALPGIGVRMDRNEQQMTSVVDAVAQIAPALTQMAEQSSRLDDHAKRIEENARNIAELKSAYMERIANHMDSAAAWTAIESVARRDPDETND